MWSINVITVLNSLLNLHFHWKPINVGVQANIRSYYQKFEEQQTQILIDQKIKEHLGQTVAYQQIGAVYNQHLAAFPGARPRLPVMPPPMFQGPPQMVPGIRPPMLPIPVPGAPGKEIAISIFVSLSIIFLCCFNL